jgi:hypothetical protein
MWWTIFDFILTYIVAPLAVLWAVAASLFIIVGFFRLLFTDDSFHWRL